MATTPTTNYSFGKPTVGGSADTWGTENNAAWDAVDAALKVVDDAGDANATAISQGVPVGTVQDFLRKTAPTGWTILGGTIGDASSGATLANAGAEALFTLLWGEFTDGELPVLTSAGSGSTRGVDAATDWAAHKRLTLPAQQGKFRRSYGGTSAAIGVNQAEMVGPHTHTVASGSDNGSGPSPQIAIRNNITNTGTTTSDGGGTENRPANIAYLTCIKL